MNAAAEQYERTTGPVHAYFGLTYSNFLVLHRAHLQSMPLEWQSRIVELLEDLGAAYDLGDASFEVKTVRDAYVDELTDDEMQQLGITREYGAEETTYTDATGRELSAGWHHVGVPVPDHVPHYKHAYLPPDEEAIAAVRRAREEGS
jgi:hypothetical protein